MQDSISRVSIVYRGGLADEHVLVSKEMGTSILGLSRAYSSVAHTIITGKVPGKRTEPVITCYSGPPYQGSVGQDIIIATIQAGIAGGALNLPWDAVKGAFDLLLGKITEGFTNLLTGRNQDMEKALDVIGQMSAQQNEVTKILANGILKNQADSLANAAATQNALLGVVQRLAETNRSAVRDMVQPVGNSCGTSTHSVSNKKELSYTYDLSMAAELRKDEETVGQIQPYTVSIAAVATLTGNSKFQVDGLLKPIKGHIADPALKLAGNAYTHALDTKSRLTIAAKPIFDEDGEIKSFVVMDAQQT